MSCTNILAPKHSVVWVSLILGFFVSLAFSAPINTTPSCTRNTWQDIIVFYAVNYLAHAGSIPSPAGAKWHVTLQWFALALFLPFSGLGRSVALISRYLLWRDNALSKAFASDAVAVMVRSMDWEPTELPVEVYVQLPPDFRTINAEEEVSIIFDDNDYLEISFDDYHVHGHSSQLQARLGYSWIVPTEKLWQHIVSCELGNATGFHLSRSHSWLKMAVSIAQLIYACITLYSTRGNQIEEYGYAAFGFSVFPFAFMSFFNFICVGPIGEYPSIFTVRTGIMQEAQRREPTQSHDAMFDGAIGCLKTNGENSKPRTPTPLSKFVPAQLSIRNAPSGRRIIVTADGITKEFKFERNSASNCPRLRIHRAIAIDKHDEDCPYYHSNDASQTKSPKRASAFIANLIFWAAPVFVLVLPHLLIFLLSRFQKGRSTVARRVWMMAWVCINQFSYLPFAILTVGRPGYYFSWANNVGKFFLIFSCVLSVAAIGGYAEVGIMLTEFRSCPMS